ncbi:MAG: enoyl-CoA hydratase/isomerase family protein [Dehalococcoidia bacterium]|nr:enoyl-CoA hydratase/isomerase family protein [Dehalococcoidia bacterium]
MLIRMNRPERLNALGSELLTQMVEAWCEYRDTPELKVAILTGVGKAFCAGEDLKEAAERGTPGLPDIPVRDPFWNMELDKPVIAAVNGWAMGGGYILTYLADFRIAVPEAVFEISEARHWLLGAYKFGFTESLPYAIATELAMGFPLTAKRAHEVGFINRLVEPEELLPEAFRIADHLLSLPPASLVNTLEICRRLRPRIPAEIDELGARLRNRGAVEDIMESRRAFREKRKPVFKGF